MMSGFRHPICEEALSVSAEMFRLLNELEKAEMRRGYLRMLIVKAQDELKKEYGAGYITRKRVKKSRFPIFRSLERGKDYNLERNFPDIAKIVTEYFDTQKRIKELNSTLKKLNRFIDTAYIMCVPPEVRNSQKSYKARKMAKDIAYVSNLEDELQAQCEDGKQEACDNLRELEECMAKGFRVEGKRIICS